MIDLVTLVVRNHEPITAIVDNEVVMMSIDASSYFGLNGIGSEIWHRLEQPMRVEDLCSRLEEQYDVDKRKIVDDVIRFLEELSNKDLVRIVPPAKGSGA